jgi:hypothetical protein
MFEFEEKAGEAEGEASPAKTGFLKAYGRWFV